MTMSRRRDRVHIFPVDAQYRSNHETRMSECWCEPTPRQVCPETDELDRCAPGCYRCGGTGWVWCYDEALPIALLHSIAMRREAMA